MIDDDNQLILSLNKYFEKLFQALREYFRSNVFSSLKELKIREHNNLYESILDSVAEYGWLTDLKNVEDNLTPKSYKLLLEKLSSFYKSQGNYNVYLLNGRVSKSNLDSSGDCTERENAEYIAYIESIGYVIRASSRPV